MKIDYNIVFLRNFVETANIGNITSAAERLFITQSTLSRQLQNLEETLNITLFKRTKSGVELTMAGFAFYKQCIKLVKSYNEFVSQTAVKFNKALTGTLNIAQQRAGEDISVRMNGSFLKEFPYIDIRNYHNPDHNWIHRLESGALDLVYLYGGELDQKYKGINSLQVGELDNMLLTSRNHSLAKQNKIHLSRLRNEPFIFPSKAIYPGRIAEIIQKCDIAGFVPQAVSYVDNIVDYMLEITRYNGVAIIPCMSNVNQTMFKYLKLDGYPQKYPIRLVWSEENTNPILPVYLSYIEGLLDPSPELNQKAIG